MKKETSRQPLFFAGLNLVFQHLFHYDLLPLGWPNSHDRNLLLLPAYGCEMIIPALEHNLSGLEDVADMQRTSFATIERVENMRKFFPQSQRVGRLL